MPNGTQRSGVRCAVSPLCAAPAAAAAAARKRRPPPQRRFNAKNNLQQLVGRREGNGGKGRRGGIDNTDKVNSAGVALSGYPRPRIE